MEPKKKKKSACLVYIDTCVPWMAIETKKKKCVLCEKEKKEKKIQKQCVFCVH